MSKITIDRELLEKAIETMDGVHAGEHHGGIEVSIAALQEALAQPTSGDYARGYAEGFNDACKPALPQHKPVAEVQVKMTGGNAGIATIIREIYDPLRWPLKPGDKLYTSPPARKPLTVEQVEEVWVAYEKARPKNSSNPESRIQFARAIEAAHGIKEMP